MTPYYQCTSGLTLSLGCKVLLSNRLLMFTGAVPVYVYELVSYSPGLHESTIDLRYGVTPRVLRRMTGFRVNSSMCSNGIVKWNAIGLLYVLYVIRQDRKKLYLGSPNKKERRLTNLNKPGKMYWPNH